MTTALIASRCHIPRPSQPTVYVRDSKDQEGARLAFADDAWSAFLGTYSA
ncbi:DUF397 domain-containing protein [Streptomyces sp. WM6386]